MKRILSFVRTPYSVYELEWWEHTATPSRWHHAFVRTVDGKQEAIDLARAVALTERTQAYVQKGRTGAATAVITHRDWPGDLGRTPYYDEHGLDTCLDTYPSVGQRNW